MHPLLLKQPRRGTGGPGSLERAGGGRDCGYMKWKKRHTFFACIVLLLLAAAGIGLTVIQRRAKIADIISDEAAWDARDAAAQVAE